MNGREAIGFERPAEAAYEIDVRHHLRMAANRQLANARALKSVVVAFISTIFVFGGFYLGWRLGSF
jgi:hypothetical protein